jgi:hypothetical protein
VNQHIKIGVAAHPPALPATNIALGEGVMLKFHFSIQTREGQKINSLIIGGRDKEHAEIKLRQMYRYCDILRCDVQHGDIPHDDQQRVHAGSLEDILALITR